MSTLQTAASRGLVQCHVCHFLSHTAGPRAPHPARCPRCQAALHERKPHALSRSTALLIAAAILYIPANTLPIMAVTQLGKGQPDTILSGVQELVVAGMWPLAAIVFIASFVVPVAKMAVLAYLIASVHRRSRHSLRDRARLFRVTEAVGRWSMIDIYVVTILVALVKLGAIANIDPGPGAISFAAVVILTILAAESFDSKAIWDPVNPSP